MKESVLVLLLVGLVAAVEKCELFEPFTVRPDRAAFQIGAVLPLHESDCSTVRPHAVQELFAIQWAITHWNQEQRGEHAKQRIALIATDSCSRNNATVAQLVSYLEETGRFKPDACLKAKPPTQLGVILPPDPSTASAMRATLQTFNVPAVAYSTAAAKANPQASAVAPRLGHYVKVLKPLLSALKSNYVNVLSLKQYQDSAAELKDGLGRLDIFSDELIHDYNTNFADLSANVVLAVLDSEAVARMLREGRLLDTKKVIIVLTPESGSSEGKLLEQVTQYGSYSRGSTLLFVQPRQVDIESFAVYFLDILLNNYDAHPLLTAYMQQVYDCSLDKDHKNKRHCASVSQAELESGFSLSPRIEPVVLAAYSLAAFSSVVPDNTRPLTSNIDWASLLQRVNYSFSQWDPIEFLGSTLSFGADGQLNGLIVEGYQLTVNEHGVGSVNKFLETLTGMEDATRLDMGLLELPSDDFESTCPRHRSFCHHCAQRVTDSRFILHKPGDLYLVGLFDWHSSSADSICGDVREASSVIGPLSFLYVVETLRERYAGLNFLQNVELGALLLDTCGKSANPLLEVSQLNERCLTIPHPTEAFNVTIHSDMIGGYVAGLPFHSYNVLKDLFTVGAKAPLTAPVQTPSSQTYNTFSTMPLYNIQAQAIVDLLLAHDWNYVSVLLSETDLESTHAFESFRKLAEQNDICIADIVHLASRKTQEHVEIQSAQVSIAFSTATDTAAYIQRNIDLPSFHTTGNLILILVGDAHNWDNEVHRPSDHAWRSKFFGSLSVQPRLSQQMSLFGQFLKDLSPQKLPEPWFVDFWEDYFKCSLRHPKRPGSKRKVGRYARPCEGIERFPVESLIQPTKESYIMSDVENLLFSIDALYKRHCPEGQGFCDLFYERVFDELPTVLRAIPRDSEFVIYNYRPSAAGANKAEYKLIGNWSSTAGLQFSISPAFYLNGRQTAAIPQSQCYPPACRCSLDDAFFKVPISYDFSPESLKIPANPRGLHDGTKSVSSLEQKPWHKRTWSFIFLAINSVLLLCALCVLVLIVAKVCMRVIKGNQSLGICLLCSVIMLYVTAYLFIVDPTDLICKLRYVMHSFAYSLCFGVLIAKAVQLCNSETVGTNGYVSYWNYWLMLFFIVGVTVALNLQWTLFKSPAVIKLVASEGFVVNFCAWTTGEFLLAQAYVLVLLVLALVVSISARNVKRNYQEARWLIYTTTLSIPIWACWMITYSIVPDNFKDTVTVVELITCATLVLGFMFGPKLYILLSYEPVLITYPSKGNHNNTMQKQPLNNSVSPQPGARNSFARSVLLSDRSSSRSSSPARSTRSGHSTQSTSLSTMQTDEAPTPLRVAAIGRHKKRGETDRELVAALPTSFPLHRTSPSPTSG